MDEQKQRYSIVEEYTNGSFYYDYCVFLRYYEFYKQFKIFKNIFEKWLEIIN